MKMEIKNNYKVKKQKKKKKVKNKEKWIFGDLMMNPAEREITRFSSQERKTGSLGSHYDIVVPLHATCRYVHVITDMTNTVGLMTTIHTSSLIIAY